MNRRTALLLGVTTICGVALADGLAQAQPAASLKETLLYGLRPRTPNEQDFINTVVAKVDSRELKLEEVMALFQWSRSKKPYPFPYFERAVRARAEKAGVTL